MDMHPNPRSTTTIPVATLRQVTATQAKMRTRNHQAACLPKDSSWARLLEASWSVVASCMQEAGGTEAAGVGISNVAEGASTTVGSMAALPSPARSVRAALRPKWKCSAPSKRNGVLAKRRATMETALGATISPMVEQSVLVMEGGGDHTWRIMRRAEPWSSADLMSIRMQLVTT